MKILRCAFQKRFKYFFNVGQNSFVDYEGVLREKKVNLLFEYTPFIDMYLV